VRFDTCDLDDGIEALAYWRERRDHLPWRRRRARAEADVMVARWERRVRIALLDDPAAPIGARIEAGVLVLRTRARILGRRWARRLAIATVAGAVLMGAGFVFLVSLFF
jgi:hypothetical protein